MQYCSNSSAIYNAKNTAKIKEQELLYSAEMSTVIIHTSQLALKV